MTALEQKILNIAKSHPEYNEDVAIKELSKLSSMDLIGELWKLRDKKGDKNRLNLSLAYYMGITSSKPTAEFKLEKRRTYGRAGFPDIDMDFDYVRRSEIVDYLRKKYGSEHVGNIGTIQTFKTKASIRRAIKVSDPTHSVRFDKRGIKIKDDSNPNFALENEILKTLPKLMRRADGSSVNSVKESYEEYPEFAKYMDSYPDVYTIAQNIEGTMSGSGCHAAGILLSPVPLCRIAPLHNTTGRGDDGPEKVVATQFPMADVENLGLIKFDILGLSTLTAINWACKSIEEGGTKVDWKNISLNDSKTFDLLKSGKTDGIFQLENWGMKECLRQINIDSFEDLAVAIAMYRPGPKDYIPDFAARKHGKVKVVYAHPLLEQITKPTYSIICYQEQVMQAFMILSGLTASDGYSFIKGCAKKKPEIIEGFKVKFFKGCQNNNIDSHVVQKIWKDLEKFAGYSFNRSLLFSENIITSKKEFSIQELHDMKKKGEALPQVFSSTGEKINILDVYDHGILPVYKVTFENELTVSCTLNHKFMTSEGMVLSLHEILNKNLTIIQYAGMNSNGKSKQELDTQRMSPVCVQREIPDNISSASNRFYLERLKSYCRLWLRPILSKRIFQRIKYIAKQRQEVQQSHVQTRIFGNSNFLRYLAFARKPVPISTPSKTLNDSFVLPRSRCCENNWKSLRITKIKFIGNKQCYDLEVDSDDHLYCLANGIVNQNSHAVSYALMAYKTAYLKAHYPTEFITARLSVESYRRNFDDIEKYEKDAIKNFGFTILKTDINLSKAQWSIIGEKKILRPLLQKGVGIKAAEDIESHQPYDSSNLLYSFARRSGSVVSSKVVESMKDNGMWEGISKDHLKKDFLQIRKDKKRLKGRPTKDIFG